MVQNGAFGAELAGEVNELVFWHIPGGFEPGSAVLLFGKAHLVKTAEVVETAQSRLRDLVADFDDPARAYLSQPTPGSAPRFSDYRQLARVAEWAAVDDEPPLTEV